MIEPYQILMVEDDPQQAELVMEFLRVSGPFNTEWAASIHALWGSISQKQHDIILLDYKLPDGTGLQALKKLRQQGDQTPVIMITGQGDERLAVEVMQLQAADYLIKGSNDLLKLPSLIQKAIREYELEQSMQRSLEQIRHQALLLNNVRDAIIVWNADGEITYWNPAAEMLLGLTSKDCLGKSVEEVYIHLFDPPVRTPSREGTSGMEIERCYKTRDGHKLWVSSRVSVLRDYGGSRRMIGYMDVLRNITERKRAEDALRVSQERYALATAAAKVGVWDWNLTTGEYYLDPNVKELLGYQSHEIRNSLKDWSALVHPEDYARVMDAARAHIEGRTPEYACEHRMLHKDGSIRWIDVHGQSIHRTDGQVIRLIGTNTDITERKAMEAQLQAAQAKLTQSMRLSAIGELASGVAHHINNPLTTVIAEAQLMLHSLERDHPARESAQAIEEAGWRMQKTVQKLIEFSQPSSDTIEAVDVNATIELALALIGDTLRFSGVQLDAELAQQLPQIHGSSQQLGDLWVNLLMMARDGAVDSQAHHIQIHSLCRQDHRIQVEIHDNGKSIPNADLLNIFEPNFLRGPGGRGSGLEFNICQEIVRQHNGQIRVESSAGRGTIFRVSFPVEVTA